MTLNYGSQENQLFLTLKWHPTWRLWNLMLWVHNVLRVCFTNPLHPDYQPWRRPCLCHPIHIELHENFQMSDYLDSIPGRRFHAHMSNCNLNEHYILQTFWKISHCFRSSVRWDNIVGIFHLELNSTQIVRINGSCPCSEANAKSTTKQIRLRPKFQKLQLCCCRN